MNNLQGSNLDITDPNLVCDDRVRQVFTQLVNANLTKNQALLRMDGKLQICADFLLSVCNNESLPTTVQRNARTALEYCGLRNKSPIKEIGETE